MEGSDGISSPAIRIQLLKQWAKTKLWRMTSDVSKVSFISRVWIFIKRCGCVRKLDQNRVIGKMTFKEMLTQ